MWYIVIDEEALNSWGLRNVSSSLNLLFLSRTMTSEENAMQYIIIDEEALRKSCGFRNVSSSLTLLFLSYTSIMYLVMCDIFYCIRIKIGRVGWGNLKRGVMWKELIGKLLGLKYWLFTRGHQKKNLWPNVACKFSLTDDPPTHPQIQFSPGISTIMKRMRASNQG